MVNKEGILQQIEHRKLCRLPVAYYQKEIELNKVEVVKANVCVLTHHVIAWIRAKTKNPMLTNCSF
jgi:hypothetical protein